MSPDADRRTCHVLVACAGSGSRAGTDAPKQYVRLAGRPVIGHTLAALARVRGLRGALVVLAPDDDAFERAADAPPGFRVTAVRCGGSHRAVSVGNGLDALLAGGAAADDWVLVHDAARCLVQPEWIERLMTACVSDAVGGLLALPVADTLKRERGGRVAATVDRAGLWQAQTPQMFRLGMLRAALAAAGADATDEASAMEAAGHAPLLVTGALENFKLTYPADFALAERLLQARNTGQSP